MPRKKRTRSKGKQKASSSDKSIRQSNNRNSSDNKYFGLSNKQRSTLYYVVSAIFIIFLFCAFFIYLPNIRKSLGLGSSTSYDPAKQRGYKTRLRKLYEKYNPNKVDEIDDILLKWRGKEKELFKILHKKYRKNNKKVPRDRDRKNKDRRKNDKREDETEEEATQRRRKEKEKDRDERRKKRKEERGGEDYYDDWEDDLSPENQKKYNKYFDDSEYDAIFGENIPFYEGEVPLVDDDSDDTF